MFSCTNNSQTTLKDQAYDMETVSTWYKVSSMKVSSKKISVYNSQSKPKAICQAQYKSHKYMRISKVDLLCLAIDNQLTFQDHIDMLCPSANYYLYVLRRIKKYLSLEKAKLLYSAFKNSQFSYADFIWMLHRRKYTIKIFFKKNINHQKLQK